MVSIIGQTVVDKYVTYTYVGKSTDIKPTAPNGSKFKEIDTGNEYYFDGDEHEWILKAQNDLPHELVSIAFDMQPYKTLYSPNETLDITGAIVYAYYLFSEPIDVTDLCTFEPANGTTLTESCDLVATYTDGGITKTASVTIVVQENNLV